MRSAIFPEDPPNGAVVALTDFNPAEVLSLVGELERLAKGEASAVVIHGEVRLTLRNGERDIGILEHNASDAVCVLRPATWLQVSGLMEPFTQAGVDGFQWLDDTGPVKLLISRAGTW